MKKTVLALIALLAAVSPALCLEAVEGNLEISGLLSMGSGGIYGGGIQAVGSYGTDFYPSDGIFDSVGSANLDMVLSLMLWNESPQAMLAPYFRFSTVYYALETGMEALYTMETADRRDVLDMAYFGAGLKRYLHRPGDNLRFYAGLDIGYFSTVFMNTNSSITYYDPAGIVRSADRVPSYRGGYLGGHAEAGLEFWLNDKAAISFKAGLRMGGGKIKGTNSSTEPARDGIEVTQQVNSGGLYFGAGLNVALGYKKYPGKPGLDYRKAQLRRDELISGGDEAYSAGDYGAALVLYDRALAYGRSAELLARIGGALYFTGDKSGALGLFRAAEMSPDYTAELKRWIAGVISTAETQPENKKGGTK